jgi:hypothetical protein
LGQDSKSGQSLGGDTDNVQLGLSMVDGAISGRVGQCPVGPDNVWLGVSVLDGFGKDLELIDLIIFHFIQHTPLNSMLFLYSRNIKDFLKHA